MKADADRRTTLRYKGFDYRYKQYSQTHRTYCCMSYNNTKTCIATLWEDKSNS